MESRSADRVDEIYYSVTILGRVVQIWIQISKRNFVRSRVQDSDA
jgi:hypothetical protein